MRTFGPKAADHPSCGKPCFLCGKPFAVGDMTALIPIRPGDDDELAKWRAGLACNFIAEEAHAECVEIQRALLRSEE